MGYSSQQYDNDMIPDKSTFDEKAALQALHKKIAHYNIKGFLDAVEAQALYMLAQQCSQMGPCLEVGSYCGLSTVYLGDAVKLNDGSLYAVDHHRGSEEHQLGEAYHDAALFDSSIQGMNSFPYFRRTLDQFDLVNTVVPIVSASAIAARDWGTPLSMVFIDGGHSETMSLEDCMVWGRHVMSGGVLAIHDIFPNPADGGQGPYQALLAVQAEYGFVWETTVKSLGVLRKP